MTRPKPGSRGVVSPVLVSAVLVSTVLDVCCVLAFVAIGRHTHHDGHSIAGMWHTAWPFLAGLAIGLGAARAWRRPLALLPAGLGAWLGAAVAGMVLRVLAGQGTALAFIGVTLAFLGLFILGWRVVARIVIGQAAGGALTPAGAVVAPPPAPRSEGSPASPGPAVSPPTGGSALRASASRKPRPKRG